MTTAGLCLLCVGLCLLGWSKTQKRLERTKVTLRLLLGYSRMGQCHTQNCICFPHLSYVGEKERALRHAELCTCGFAEAWRNGAELLGGNR